MDLVNVAGNSNRYRINRKKQKVREWTKITEKQQGYTAKDIMLTNWINNNQINKKIQCKHIDLETLQYAKKCFYKDDNRNNQNSRIGNLIQIHTPRRQRKRDHVKSHKPYDLQITYRMAVEYYNIYKQLGNVKVLGDDWLVYDLKGVLQVLQKLEGINEQKRIFIKKATQQRNKKKNLVKRAKTIESFSLKEINTLHGITAVTGKSVDNLLKVAFGTDWIRDESLVWYFDILKDFIRDVNIPAEKENEGCTCIAEDQEIQV
ncbi:hypothetical protein QE152_g23502 [Popillia japonica]|uniref:Uncharacterized protein n=1 Tax=Popillia japonica TaxID=7064 RepID=A0AAW1KH00_POPJA